MTYLVGVESSDDRQSGKNQVNAPSSPSDVALVAESSNIDGV